MLGSPCFLVNKTLENLHFFRRFSPQLCDLWTFVTHPGSLKNNSPSPGQSICCAPQFCQGLVDGSNEETENDQTCPWWWADHGKTTGDSWFVIRKEVFWFIQPGGQVMFIQMGPQIIQMSPKSERVASDWRDIPTCQCDDHRKDALNGSDRHLEVSGSLTFWWALVWTEKKTWPGCNGKWPGCNGCNGFLTMENKNGQVVMNKFYSFHNYYEPLTTMTYVPVQWASRCSWYCKSDGQKHRSVREFSRWDMTRGSPSGKHPAGGRKISSSLHEKYRNVHKTHRDLFFVVLNIRSENPLHTDATKTGYLFFCWHLPLRCHFIHSWNLQLIFTHPLKATNETQQASCKTLNFNHHCTVAHPNHSRLDPRREPVDLGSSREPAQSSQHWSHGSCYAAMFWICLDGHCSNLLLWITRKIEKKNLSDFSGRPLTQECWLTRKTFWRCAGNSVRDVWTPPCESMVAPAVKKRRPSRQAWTGSVTSGLPWRTCTCSRFRSTTAGPRSASCCRQWLFSPNNTQFEQPFEASLHLATSQNWEIS